MNQIAEIRLRLHQCKLVGFFYAHLTSSTPNLVQDAGNNSWRGNITKNNRCISFPKIWHKVICKMYYKLFAATAPFLTSSANDLAQKFLLNII
jgi:hypothetical protein